MIDLIFPRKSVKDFMMSYNKWIGVDVSKDVVDVAIFSESKYALHQVKNDKKSLFKFFSKIKEVEKSHVIMEATGIYHLVLLELW